jgi:hypothetical protein
MQKYAEFQSSFTPPVDPGAQRLESAIRQLSNRGSELALDSNLLNAADPQVAVMVSNLEQLQSLHSAMIHRRLKSNQTATDFGRRIGLTAQTVDQFESAPLEASIATALLYLMGAGVAIELSVDQKGSWDST